MNCDKVTLSELYNDKQLSLREIGKLYGYSCSTIMQIMDGLELPRRTQRDCVNLRRFRGEHVGRSIYATIEDYLAKREGRKHDCSTTLKRLLLPAVCEECGGNGYMHIHHINYPATSRDDLEILCASCHFIKHRKGISPTQQQTIYDMYMAGGKTEELATLFNVARITIYKVLNKVKNSLKTYRH